MKTFAAKLQQRLREHHHEPVIVEEVTIDLLDGECPEYLADELALWCHKNGLRARRMDRSRRHVVRFGFEAASTANEFRRALGISKD